MSNHFIKAQVDGTYDVVVMDDFTYQGTFATAVSTYCEDTETCEKYLNRKKQNLKGIMYMYPLAEMEQVIVALWATIPKFGFSKKYKQMLREVGLVVNYFQCGDLALFEEAVSALPDYDKADPDPIDILLSWEDFLANVAFIEPDEVDLDEDEDDELGVRSLTKVLDQESVELEYAEV